jgi:uncharacterized protein YcbK (DUF882 family)/muramidase (phage lysozyme)
MARQKVRDISAPSALVPQAAPVNTYVRPADPAPSNLHDLANGLAQFDRDLSGFLEKRQEKANTADKVRGEAAFNKNNQVGWAEAVRQGLVPAHASPIFVQSYKKAQGNLAGMRLREKFSAAYSSWDGRNSNDPEAFAGFVSSFLKDNIQTDDPYILEGLNPHIEALTDGAYTMWGKEREASTYNGSVNTKAAIAGETIDSADRQGLASGDGTDYDALREDLLKQREESLADGTLKEDYDLALVKAIAAKAIEHGDPQLLKILDEVWPGYDDVKLSSIPAFRDIKQATLDAIETDARTRMHDSDRRQVKEDKKKEDAIVRGVVDLLSQDPTIEIPEDIIKEWTKYDPMARTKLEKARKTLLDAQKVESPRDLLHVERLIQEGATTQDIMDLVKDGVITDPQTLKGAIDRVEKRQKARLEGRGILTTQTSKRFLSTIKERTAADKIGAMFAPEGLTDEGLEATKDFEQMLIQWEEQNPDATLMDREKAINEIGELILKRIIPDERQYISPEDAKRMRDEANAAAEAAKPPSPEDRGFGKDPVGSAPIPEDRAKSFWRVPSREEVKDALSLDLGITRPREADTEARRQWEVDKTAEYYGGDQPPKLEDMDPVYREKIAEKAKAAGMTPEEYNMGIWNKINDAVNKATDDQSEAETVDGNVHKSSLTVSGDSADPTDRISDTIEQAVIRGETNTASAVSDPVIRKTAPILDLLGHSEGTDRGRGYNETVAYGAYTGGDVELTNMTLDDIDRLQTVMLRSPDNSLNSSAVGRYQILRKTLRDLRKNMKLSGDEKFTPELQDRLAMELLKGRGLEKWMDGKMSDTAFMDSMAKEWASVPMHNGNGYYDGQRTGVTTGNMLAAFDAVLGRKTAIAEAGNLDHIHTSSDRGYDPDMDNVKDSVKSTLLAVQKKFGKALPVVSGFRDVKRNAKAGGAKKSQHTHGNAVDISVRDMPIKERQRLIEIASEMGFTGIGVYANSLHFDLGGRRYWGPDHHKTSLPTWAKDAMVRHMKRSTSV